MIAANKRHPEVVKLLIARGAALAPKQAPFTALHAAALANDAEIIALLLSAGADPRARDIRGKTAFDAAVACGGKNAMRALLPYEQIRETSMTTRPATTSTTSEPSARP
jgi:ankyrin repeat protein